MYAYSELLSKFNRSTIPNKRQYKLENNTYVYFDSTDNFVIELHESNIARITQDKIILDSCSWRTPTTKDRLNKILSDNKTGYTIYQVNHQWKVYKNSIPWRENEFYIFADGITFKWELNARIGNGWEIYNFAQDNTQEINQLRRKITKYVNQFYNEFALGKIPIPDAGDCWECSMFKTDDKLHLLSHIEESYFVPSLLVNAFKDSNYSMFAHDCMAAWINQDKIVFNQCIKIVGYQIKKSLYKYLVDKLITN